MLVLGVNGSPRKYGASYRLLLVALESSRLAGASYRVLHLYEYELKPCAGCFSDSPEDCREPCPMSDDWPKIKELLIRADAVIVSTPVYWYGPSGAVKTLIDRMTVLENKSVLGEENPLEGKAAGVIAAGLEEGSSQAGYYLAQALNAMGMIIPPYGVVHYTGLEDPLEVGLAVIDAANLGRAVVLAAQAASGKRWYDKDIDTRSLVERARKEAGFYHGLQKPRRER